MTNPATHDAPQIVKHWTESEPVRLAGHRAGRVYLAGPMTGLPEFNFPAFNAEAAILRAQGLTVINPAEHGIVQGAEWADYLRHDIAGLASCERIHLLRGWENSKGARLEVHIAQQLGMAITRQEGATLQAKPAEVSDAEIIAIKKATKAADPTQPWGDTLAFARAILALRPQAESEARRAAQEQLYTERERHTAEVKRLQAEIGRLQSLRPAAQTEREAWVPYLVDRADGVKGHYAIGRWNPRGYREVWNLHSHRWAAYSDDVMSLEEADSLLRQITIPTVRASLPAPQQATPEPERGMIGMGAQALAGELGAALNADLQMKNAIGMLGANTMAWLRKVAAEYLSKPATPEPVGEPFGWLFQHEETGRVQVVDSQQVELGFEANNPRWQKIRPVYTRPAPGVPEGFALVPIKSDDAILRPFYNCPPEELGLAWDAAMRVAQVRLAAAQAKGADHEDLAAAGVMLMGRRADHD